MSIHWLTFNNPIIGFDIERYLSTEQPIYTMRLLVYYCDVCNRVNTLK